MQLHDSVSRSRSLPAARGLLVSSLFCVVVLGCGPTAAPTDATTESTSTTTSSTATADPGVTEPSVTDPGGTTIAVTTSTSSSATTEPTPTTTDPNCAFLCVPDMPTSLECDVFLQECPEGQKCAPIIIDDGGAWNSSACVPVTGTDVAGDPCIAESVADGLDSCAEGHMCWGVDQEGHGTCVAQCQGSPDAPICPDNGVCTIAADGFLALCLPCSPLFQDCYEGDGCYPLDDHFVCAPDESGDTGVANDPCELNTVCDPGLLCLEAAVVGKGCSPDSFGCCTPFCELPGGACPNPDQQCLPYFDPQNIPPAPWDAIFIGFCGFMP